MSHSNFVITVLTHLSKNLLQAQNIYFKLRKNNEKNQNCQNQLSHFDNLLQKEDFDSTFMYFTGNQISSEKHYMKISVKQLNGTSVHVSCLCSGLCLLHVYRAWMERIGQG